MGAKQNLVIVLMVLVIAYIGVNYLQEDGLTGKVISEYGEVNAIDYFLGYGSGINMSLQEEVTTYSVATLDKVNITSALKDNDGEDKTSRVDNEDSQEYSLSGNRYLNVTFSEDLDNNDLVTVVSKNSGDKEVVVCDLLFNCNISNVVFNSSTKTYNITLTGLSDDASQLLVDSSSSVDINYIYGLKNNLNYYNTTSYDYPDELEAISEEISLPSLSTVHNVLFNETLNNQPVKYEYSDDDENWFLLTNPLDKEMTRLWLKITLYSDGNFTPVINGVEVNYSTCIKECFPSNIEINRTAQISLMKDEAALLNASFSTIVINSSQLQLNKSVSVLEYNETSRNYSKKPLERFIDIDSDVANASFKLRMDYEQGYIDENKIDELTIKVHYFNPGTNEWEALNSSIVNSDEDYVEAILEHLSTYGLFGEEVTETAPASGSGGSHSSGRITTTTSTIASSTTIPETTTTLWDVEKGGFAIVDKIEDRGGETSQEEKPQSVFRVITGGVVNVSKKIFKWPNLLLPGIVLISALAYLIIRVRRLKRIKGMSQDKPDLNKE